MIDDLTRPPGYLVKVEDFEGDPLARYFRVRIPDPEEAVTKVLAQVPEKMGHPERNLTEREVEDMQPGEVSPQ
jgi:hypothetical protein